MAYDLGVHQNCDATECLVCSCPCFVDGSGRGLKKQSTCAFERAVPPLIGMEVTVRENLLNVQLRGEGDGNLLHL